MSGPNHPPRRRRLLVVLVALAALLTGCQADVLVDIRVVEDGSGTVAVTVTADQDAASMVLDLTDEGLRVDDLAAAGWTLTPPAAAPDGSVRTTATKPFGTPEQFSEIMDELSGPDGLFQGFTLSRDRSFAQVDFAVEGRISPQDVAVFGDDQLVAVLGEELVDLIDQAGGSAADVDLAVSVRLPGTIDTAASTGAQVFDGPDDTSTRLWRSGLDAAGPTEIDMSTSTQKVVALVWRGVAVLAGVLAALVLFGHVLRLVRPERRRGGRRSNRSASAKRSTGATASPAGAAATTASASGPGAPKASDSAVDSAAASAGDGGSSTGAIARIDETSTVAPRLVALDGMGVLYREGDDIAQLLVPFVRERGSEVSTDEIIARARSLSLGRITPAEFWEAVGVAGDPNVLDDDYLSLFQLNPGVVKFLRALRAEGVKVACVTNDCTTWANKLRARHSLDGLISTWVVSGAVGVRKPDPPIFEVLRRVTREEPAAILVVDDNLDNLDAARTLGFATAWFAPSAAGGDSRGHSILRSFAVAERAPEASERQ